VTISPIHRGQADQFLLLLGKDPAAARLRAFPHRLNPNRYDPKTNPNGIKARKGGYDLTVAHQWQREGRGVYLVINCGGDDDNAITLCRAFWVEWDTKPLEWQLQAWREFGLGEPSFTVTTGGKSAHLYWVLSEPITVERWRPIQLALIAATGADPVNKNPSRVMRLPGAFYLGPDGKASGQSKIHSSSDRRYSVEEVEAWLTAQPAAAEPDDADLFGGIPLWDAGDLPPRPPGALREALLKVPPFAPKQKQYPLLLGLARRLLVDLGKQGAIDILRETCAAQITDLESYFVTPSSGISPGSTWAYLRDEFGIDIRRHDLRGKHPGGAQQGQQAPPANEQAKDQQEAATRAPLLTLDEVRERLRYAVEAGASRQDLEAERIRLAAASDIPAATLQGLLVAIQREAESGLQVQQEAQRLARARDRADANKAISLDELLPPRLAEALKIRTRYLPADDVAACMAFLVCISGVVKLGTEVIASRAADYRVPLNLYGALVARSGAKKSPLSRLLVSKPTEDLRIDLARAHSRAMENWTEQNKGVKPSERPDPPKAPYLSISDATAEALAQQLQVQEDRGLGLLLHRDELAGLFGNLNQYRSGRGSDSEQLLEAYDGSGFRSLRVAAVNGGRAYSRCHLSIWGTIQPAVLQALVADGDASGLWARYLFIPLPEVVVPLAHEESDEEAAISEAAAALLAKACSHVYKLPRTSLTLDSGARKAFMNYEAQCQGAALSATLPAQGALMGKAPGKVLRVAALLHLLWCWERNLSGPISPGAIDRGILLVDHLNAWALSIHEAASSGEASDLMRLVHRLAEASDGPVAWRDVAHKLSKAQRKEIDSAAAGVAVDALAGMGLGTVERTPRGAWSYRATGALP
jgi:Protein of unknown function (DUF3987)